MCQSKKYKNPILFFIVYLCCFFVNINIFGANNLENTDIDLVYKYIDLTDENLHRDGIPQCKKDYDNNELQYSIRSVIENIPWVRKIFIIMPNEKVKFLKDSSEISEKIVYIKDKDFLGFDSASSVSFEFNLWRLKNFGCSKNFIYMNDDYFIGKPLEKSDFFYEDNNKIVPYALHKNKIAPKQYNNIKKYHHKLKRQIKNAHAHSGYAWRYTRMSALLFLCDMLKNKNIKLPHQDLNYGHHNAIGENLTELKEIYDLVNNSYKYADECLRAKFRNTNELQHQTLYTFYILNKYNRKIGDIFGKYIDLSSAQDADFNHRLYCINTGSNKTDGGEHYKNIDYIKARIKMMNLFPRRTKYEIPDILDGTYNIINKSNEFLVNSTEKFEIKYNPSGCYTINSNSLKNINSEELYIVPVEKDYFCIVSKSNNLCLDLTKDDVKFSEINGSDSQKFKFIKT